MYNFKIKNEKFIRPLLVDLIKILKTKKTDFFDLNEKCTQDTLYWIRTDWVSVIKYLKDYEKNNKEFFLKKMKPKGSVLIILSYNEPLILSIVPVLNALVAGNKVKLRPSRKANKIIKSLWVDSGIIEKYGLDMEILFDIEPEQVESQIKIVNAVYFFGGHGTAKKIFKLCARNFVEFFPEIEAADCKIFRFKNVDEINFKKDADLTLNESFSHCGQICHRIHGIIIVGPLYEQYVDSIKRQFLKLKENKYIIKKYKPNEILFEKMICDIKKSRPTEVLGLKDKKKLPLLIISPNVKSDFIKNAYFFPSLWIIGFNNENEVISFLNSRKYNLGLNIFSDDGAFINKIIDKTRLSRYTINTSHISLSRDRGWGGVWPSGYSGYKNWIEHFSDPFEIIGINKV